MFPLIGSLARCTGYAFLILGAVVSSHSDVVKLSEHNFDHIVMEEETVWLVEFYAPWCSYCTKFRENLVQVSAILQGKVKVGTVNVDEDPELASRFDIVHLPYFIIFGKDKWNPKHCVGEISVSGLVRDSLQVWREYNEEAIHYPHKRH